MTDKIATQNIDGALVMLLCDRLKDQLDKWIGCNWTTTFGRHNLDLYGIHSSVAIDKKKIWEKMKIIIFSDRSNRSEKEAKALALALKNL